jgi:hypothetical protein
VDAGLSPMGARRRLLRFGVLPGALRVRIPGHAPGSSPARRAVRLTGANLARLWRLAPGREAEA